MVRPKMNIGPCAAFFVLLVTLCDAAVIGIDMGSESFKIGIVRPGSNIDIVLNEQTKRKTPTVITYRDGERFFGEAHGRVISALDQ